MPTSTTPTIRAAASASSRSASTGRGELTLRIRIAVLGSLLLTAVLAAPAAAQDDHGDYYGGVDAYNRVLNRGESTTFQPGWFAGASYRITHIISVTGEAAADYHSENGASQHITTFSGGVRFQSGARSARVRPFATI